MIGASDMQREAERLRTDSPEEENAQGDLSALKYLLGRCKDDEARLNGAQRKDNRKRAQIETQEIASKYKKNKLPREFVKSPSSETIKIIWT